MLTGLWLFLGLLGWLSGYFQSGSVRKEGLFFLITFIRPPFFIYLICGMPRASNLPRGVIATSSVMSQILGILVFTYGIMWNRIPNQNVFFHAFILFTLTNGVLLLCWLLNKRYKYPG